MSDDTKGTKGTTKGKENETPILTPAQIKAGLAEVEIPADLYFIASGAYDARSPDYVAITAGCDLLHKESEVLAINEKRITKALRRVETPVSAQVAISRESDPIINVSYTIAKPTAKATSNDAPGQGREWKLMYTMPDGTVIEETDQTPVRQWKYKRDEIQLAVWDKVRHCLSKVYPSLITIANVATPEEAAAAAQIATLQAQLKASKAALKTLKTARKTA